MEMDARSFQARRKVEEKVSLFAREPDNIDKILSDARNLLAARICELAMSFGWRNPQRDAFAEDIADWVSEGYLMAEERIAKWEPAEGGAAQWVALQAEELATRWFKRNRRQRLKYQQLVDRGSPLVSGAPPFETVNLVVERDFVTRLMDEEIKGAYTRFLQYALDDIPVEEIAQAEGLCKATAQRKLNRAQAKARQAARSAHQSPRGRPHLRLVENHAAPPPSPSPPSSSTKGDPDHEER